MVLIMILIIIIIMIIMLMRIIIIIIIIIQFFMLSQYIAWFYLQNIPNGKNSGMVILYFFAMIFITPSVPFYTDCLILLLANHVV